MVIAPWVSPLEPKVCHEGVIVSVLNWPTCYLFIVVCHWSSSHRARCSMAICTEMLSFVRSAGNTVFL